MVRSVFAVALAGLVVGCAAQSQLRVAAPKAEPVVYKSGLATNGGQMRLYCDSSYVNGLTCDLGLDSTSNRNQDQQKVTFSIERDYLRRLVGEAATEAMRNAAIGRDNALPPGDFEILKLVSQQSTRCFGDIELADLLVVCSGYVGQPDVVALFVRGLCDRCKFEPIVMRRVK